MPAQRKGWWRGKAEGGVDEIGDTPRVLLEEVGWDKVKREERLDIRNAILSGQRFTGADLRLWRESLGMGRPQFSGLISFSERRLIEVEGGAKYKVRFLKSVQGLAQAIAEENPLLLNTLRDYALLPLTYEERIPIDKIPYGGKWEKCLNPDCRKWFFTNSANARYHSDACRRLGAKKGIRVKPARREVGNRTVECPKCKHHFDYQNRLVRNLYPGAGQTQDDAEGQMGSTGGGPEVSQLLRRAEGGLQPGSQIPEGDGPDSDGQAGDNAQESVGKTE